MPYGWKILLNDVDISDKVTSFEITEDVSSYCRELSFALADKSIYDSFDFLSLPESPCVEVQTRVEDDWFSQGLFFVERPGFREDISSRIADQIWGRSLTAKLGSPFAIRLTQSWTEQTSFHAICEEMCDLCGITWDSGYCEPPDFIVFPNTFDVEGAYPIEVISELARLAYGDSIYITTDRENHLCIRLRDYAPTSADVTIEDDAISGISEDIEWPDFGNRIVIDTTASTGGYSIDLRIPQSCLSSLSSVATKCLARVTDQDGDPVVDGTVVDWSVEHNRVTLGASQSNTQSIFIYDELKTAKSFYEVDLDFPPSQILGIYAKADYWKVENLAAAGVIIDGNTVTLLSSLKFCDQSLRIDYLVSGVAINWAYPTSNPGTDKITASVSGNSATTEIYIDNPCACVPSIFLKVNPSSIKIGSTASLLIYVENGGSPMEDGRKVYLSVVGANANGQLEWTENYLRRVDVTNEESRAINEIAGNSQCDVDMFISAVSGVYLVDGNGDKTGSSIYGGSFAGKRITLNCRLTSNTSLLVDYTAIGAVVCGYLGLVAGTEQFQTWIYSSREAPVEAFGSIIVSPIGEDPNYQDPTGVEPREGICNEGEIECDDGLVFGVSGGTEGCFDPALLDICLKTAVFDKRYCYKNGQLGCWNIEECDNARAGSATRECPGQTVCCENKVTGITGCWPEEQCASSDDDPSSSTNWNNKNIVRCQEEGQEAETCKAGEICCHKDGEYGCFPEEECDEAEDKECYPEDCSNQGYSDTCVNGRFDEAQGRGCTCEEICTQEIEKYGATQSKMSNQGYSTIHDQAVEQGGDPSEPGYWEAYEQIKKEHMDECLEKCDQCKSAKGITVAGQEAVTAPGAYQYVQSGGIGTITWSVSGQGATIDQSGLVTLSAGACGSFTVKANDECNQLGTKSCRVTNNGYWKVLWSRYCVGSARACDLCGTAGDVISGSSKMHYAACAEVYISEYDCSDVFGPVSIEGREGWGCAWRLIDAYEWVCNE